MNDKVVLVFRSQCLPLSETFIKEQIVSYTRYRPILVGKQRVPGLDLSDVDVTLLSRWPDNGLGGLLSKVCNVFDLPPPRSIAMMKRFHPTILHAHFGPDAVRFLPLARRLDVPLVVTLHGFDVTIKEEWWRKSGGRFDRHYPDRLRTLAQSPKVHFVAVSEPIRQSAIALGLPPERVSVVHIGIDVRKFELGDTPAGRRDRRVLFVGRIVEKKGAIYLLQAFQKVHRVLPDAELVMIGDGPLLQEMKRSASNGDLPVHFAGSLSNEGVRRHLAQARVFCLPSVTARNGDTEGLPMVLLEAQACGVPVVTSARGGATEGIVDGVTGFAFPEKDVGLLADRLIKVLRDDALADSMGRAGRAFVADQFDIAKCTRTLEDLYDQILCSSRNFSGAGKTG